MKKLFLKAISAFTLLLLVNVSAFTQRGINESQDGFLNEYVSRNWTSNDGLPGMAVNDLIQDSTGYIYIGTYDGLVRFDGVEFVNYRRTYDRKYDFVSVRAIIEDSNNNLWIGHNDEGVSCINKNGDVKKYSIDNGLPNNSVRSICEDKEGRIWVGTAAGLCYIDKLGQLTIPTGGNVVDTSTLLINKLYCDTAGRIWIITGRMNELYVYSNGSFYPYTGITKIKDPAVTVVTQDKNGTFWFGVAPHYAVRVKETEETVFDAGHDSREGTTFNVIFQDSNSNLWFGMDCGITILHDGKLTHYDKSNGLADDKVTDIMEDREGNIWYSTDRGGIARLSKSKFRTFGLNTSINAICVDNERNVTWLGGDDGLYCFQDNKPVQNELTELCRDIRIRHVSMTKDNELLISTYMKLGQLCVSPDGTIKQWTKSEGLTGNKTRVSLKNKDGDIYIGTTEGLNIVDHETGEIITITKQNGVRNDYIMALYEAKDGSIWAGTDGGGVFIVKDRKVVKSYTSEEGLAGNVIFKISELVDGEIWITAGTGISRYNADTDTFSNLNSANGLGTDGIFQMLCDYTHTVWMTSNRGISSVSLDDLESAANGEKDFVNARYYGKSEGLLSGGVTSTSLCTQDKIGRVWFTLIDGYAIYNPVNSSVNNKAPVPVIQEFFIDNEKYIYDGEPILIKPESKRISIKYTALTFISSEQVTFKYKLDNFDSEFSDWTNARSVSYTNLKPGTYIFKIMSQNSDEVQSELMSDVVLIKKPSLWQIPVFWVVLVFILAGVALLVINIKMQRMRKYQAELESKVQERTVDLTREKEKSEKLLLNILPQHVAKELSENPNQTIAKKYPKVTVLFTDIINFTHLSENLSAEEVVTLLNNMVTRFDERAAKEGIEKIKSIGDAYMAASGLTDSENNDGAQKMIKFAQGLLQDVAGLNRESKVKIQVRIGINTGNLVAGVIGKTKFVYDIWGDTVNVASRMESTGAAMKIHVTQNTYNETKDLFTYSDGVELEVKGKGMMKTYFLNDDPNLLWKWSGGI